MKPKPLIHTERQADVTFTIEYEQEEDGRWLAEVKEMPGMIAYGDDPEEAVAHVEALAIRAVINRLENRENVPSS